MKFANKILPLIVSFIFLFALNADAQRSGVEVWAQTCGNCHIAQPAARYTAEKWNSIATHMIIVARLTDEEGDAVIQFLREGAKDMTSALPNAGSENDNGLVSDNKKAEPVAKQKLSQKRIKEIEAFIQKLDKEGMK